MTIALGVSSFHMPLRLRTPDAPNRAQRSATVVSKGDSGRVRTRCDGRASASTRSWLTMVQDQQRARVTHAGLRRRRRWLGVKRTWVRRLIGRQEVGLTGDRLLAITAAYRQHCERVERRAAETRAATARRWEEIDALLHGLGEPDRSRPWPRCRVGRRSCGRAGAPGTAARERPSARPRDGPRRRRRLSEAAARAPAVPIASTTPRSRDGPS